MQQFRKMIQIQTLDFLRKKIQDFFFLKKCISDIHERLSATSVPTERMP